MSGAPVVCPRCGTPGAREIVSGLSPFFDDPDVVLGGSVIIDDVPPSECRSGACRFRFGRLED